MISAAAAIAGAIILLRRIFSLRWRRSPAPSLPPEPPLISVVIPARNEVSNLPSLLDSLKQSDYPNLQIIVVDDQSTDGTAEAARSCNVELISGKPLPPGWNGKNWACHQGALRAKGEFILFTDADTKHEKDAFARALNEMKDADLLSALPFHRSETAWEKIMGPFHALIYCATNPARPRFKRLFAIGQYLLFKRSWYDRQGGHQLIASQYPDDLALANACLAQGGRYRVHIGPPLYTVRMYANFKDFINGWRRNFMAGIQQSRWQATVEVVLVIFGMTGAGKFLGSFWMGALTVLCALAVARRQKFWGEFSWTGVVFLPFALSVYCWVALLALADRLRGNSLEWKGRNYVDWKAD